MPAKPKDPNARRWQPAQHCAQPNCPPIARPARAALSQIIKELPGAAKPILARADDGNIYILKPTKNQYGTRALVNEYLGTRLARLLGLATPDYALITAPANSGLPPGPHFGSRVRRFNGQFRIHEWLPETAWDLVENPRDLAGALALDAWTANTQPRQLIFLRNQRPLSFALRLIDNSHCFGARAWSLAGIGLKCPTQFQHAYKAITSWHDFEPSLSAIESLAPAKIALAAQGVPKEWLPGTEREHLTRLLTELDRRRPKTRAILAALMLSGRPPFTRWRSDLFVASRGGALRQTA
jgi:hypothetical protein